MKVLILGEVMALASFARVVKQTIKKTVLGGTALIISLSGLFLAAPLFLVQPAEAATLSVCASGCAYGDIQSAINAANPNDTISVGAGTNYAGFSVTGKNNLTITGSGVGSTIIAPASLISSGIQHKYTSNMQVSVLVNNSTGITISNMTIKSNSSTPGAGGPDALVFWNGSTGTLSNDSITGTYTISGAQTGQGIAVDGSSGTVSLSVTGATISGFQKNGIDVIDGNGATSGGTDATTLTVSSTTITGAGSTSAIAQNGIVLWDRGGGSVSGTVTGSTISGFKYAGGGGATGILTYGTSASVTVSNSTLTNSDLDAANATTSGTFNAANNYWGASPSFTSIIGQAGDGYSTVTYIPYYLDSNRTELSSAADLTSLSLSAGTLSPTFSSGTTSYTASVDNSVSSVTASYTASPGASVSVNGSSSLAVGSNTVTVTVTSADSTTSRTYTITVTRAAATQAVPDSSGNATVNSNTPQLIVTSSSQPLTVTVGSGTNDATIDYSALENHSTNSAVVPKTTIQTQNATVQIQAGTTITASGAWDGILTAPTVKANSTVNLGPGGTVATVIEVGSSSVNLTFDNAARLLIPGQAGKAVGFERNGSFTAITTACSADSQAAGNALPAGGDCYISVGSDMVIWTKHFTTFVAYTKNNTYTVKYGDTMSGIAYKFGLTLAQLEVLNPNAGHPAGNFSLIMPGDVLSVGSAVLTASASAGSAGSSVLSTSTGGLVGTAASTTKTQVKSSNVVASAASSTAASKWYWWVITAVIIIALAVVWYIYHLADNDKKSS